MKKCIISLFMCLVMAFSLLPTAAWAELLSVTEGGQQEQVVADPSGDEVQPGDEGGERRRGGRCRRRWRRPMMAILSRC